MKKIAVPMLTLMALCVSSIFVAPIVSATDVCSNTPQETADFYVETTRASWLMSQSCVDSEVLTTMPAGSVMHVVGKTEGWHKLVTQDGHEGWMWEDFVTSTSKTFNPVSPEPEPEPEVEYIAMRDISGHKYEDAVWYVYNNGIVQGYTDGSYKPDQTINRAELLKIIVEAKYANEIDSFVMTSSGGSCFSDVPTDQWYAKYVCFAEREGIVEGYDDGTFKPAQQINFVEALKIAMIGFGYEYTEGDPWYKNIIDDASPRDFIPLDIYGFSQAFKRGQMAEMITRMMKYQESTEAQQEYLGENGVYRVTYDTIEAGLNVENVTSTGQCIDGIDLYDDQEELVKSECTTCLCDNGNWLCTGLCLE